MAITAQEDLSKWQGYIQTGGENRRALLEMAKADNGSWKVKDFYVEFSHDNFPIESYLSNGSHLHFAMKGGDGVFDGDLSASGDTIHGDWRFGDGGSQVELKRVDNASAWKVPFLYQYHSKEATYLRPAADEPLIPFSAKLALTYLEQGTTAWTSDWKCVACHTNGSYMVVRPMMTPEFGAPQKAMRDYFVSVLKEKLAGDPDDPHWRPEPPQVVYIAAGLAIWDAQVTHTLSPETAEALELMFRLQRATGDWHIDGDTDPPLESNTFQLATVAARAVANAPGWRARQAGTPIEAHIRLLEQFLRTAQKVQGDYDRTDLLWTAAEYPGLLDSKRMQDLTNMVLNHQQADGGWSIRTFALPEEWGKGNRAQKLREEPEYLHPPSDGHMTGLAIIALRKAGVPAGDARIQRGVAWLKANQRASGRWYTRSLNRDGWQYITYSGTAYPLLALSLCNALPPEQARGF